MWKRFVSKLPRESSGKGDLSSGSNSDGNAAGTGNGGTIQRTSSCPSGGLRSSHRAWWLALSRLCRSKMSPRGKSRIYFSAKLACAMLSLISPTRTRIQQRRISRGRMFAVNLFRVFPPNYRTSSSGGSEGEEEEPMFDPAWPRLHLVYDLLLKLIVSSSLDTKLGKKYFDQWRS